MKNCFAVSKCAHLFVCNDLMAGCKCDTIVGKFRGKLVLEQEEEEEEEQEEKDGQSSRGGFRVNQDPGAAAPKVSSKRAGKSVCSHLSPDN